MRVVRASGGCRLARCDRREDREAECAADLLRRIEEAGCESLVFVLEARRGDERERHEDRAHPERGKHERGQEVGEVRPVDRQLREPNQAARRQHHPGGGDRPDADPSG